MSKFLHCGRWNKNYKFILLTAIFAFFTNYIFGYIFNDYLDEIKMFNQTNDNDNNHIIINYLFRYLGLILISFILYKYELNSRMIIYNNSQENIENQINISPLFILLIMIIMVLQEISEDIFYKSNLRALDFWMFELPLLSYFNLKYFKFKIYRHHKLVIYTNLIICGILKILYLISSINDNNQERKNKSVFKYYSESWEVIPFGIFIYIIIMTSRDFALSEIKILMQYKYFSIFNILIIYGFIGIILTAIIGIISTFIECNKYYSASVLKICKIKDNTNKIYLENFKIWWNDEINISKIIILLIGVILNYCYRLFYILIIKNLTAIHIIFSFLFYTYFLGMIGNIKNYLDNKNDNISSLLSDALVLTIHTVVFIGLLIYLEMIELDFCDLNYNLKKSIMDRSIQDYELEIDVEEDEA